MVSISCLTRITYKINLDTYMYLISSHTFGQPLNPASLHFGTCTIRPVNVSVLEASASNKVIPISYLISHQLDTNQTKKSFSPHPEVRLFYVLVQEYFGPKSFRFETFPYNISDIRLLVKSSKQHASPDITVTNLQTQYSITPPSLFYPPPPPCRPLPPEVSAFHI